MTVELPALPGPQEAAWHAMFDLYERQPEGWTLVSGQLVHLHCAERGLPASRPTTDADAALDVRRFPKILMQVTTILRSPTVAGPGMQQALDRSEDVAVVVNGRSGHVPRPRDRKYLQAMCRAVEDDPIAQAAVEGARPALLSVRQLVLPS